MVSFLFSATLHKNESRRIGMHHTYVTNTHTNMKRYSICIHGVNECITISELYAAVRKLNIGPISYIHVIRTKLRHTPHTCANNHEPLKYAKVVVYFKSIYNLEHAAANILARLKSGQNIKIVHDCSSPWVWLAYSPDLSQHGEAA